MNIGHNLLRLLTQVGACKEPSSVDGEGGDTGDRKETQGIQSI